MGSQSETEAQLSFHLCTWCGEASLCSGYYDPSDALCLCMYVSKRETVCSGECFEQLVEHGREMEDISRIPGTGEDSNSSLPSLANYEEYFDPQVRCSHECGCVPPDTWQAPKVSLEELQRQVRRTQEKEERLQRLFDAYFNSDT